MNCCLLTLEFMRIQTNYTLQTITLMGEREMFYLIIICVHCL